MIPSLDLISKEDLLLLSIEISKANREIHYKWENLMENYIKLLEFVKEVEQWQIPLAITARKLLKEIKE